MVVFLDAGAAYFPTLLFKASAVVWVLLFVFLCLIFGTLAFKRKREKKKEKILKSFRLLIERALFYEDEENAGGGFLVPVSDSLKDFLQKEVFREWFIGELVRARKNLSGDATERIKLLYEQFELFKLSFHKVKALSWNVKVQGIQELYIMDQRQYLDAIVSFIDHDDANVRVEAQIAMVHFQGFQGLKFLDTVKTPITYWNRIRLLGKIATVPFQEIQGINGWLASDNVSVILFALRLACIYHVFSSHDSVVNCLQHLNEEVRLEALRTLEAIYDDSTSAQLMDFFGCCDLKLRIATLQTFEKIGSESNLTFLKEIWNESDPRIKMAASRAIISSAPDGIETLARMVEERPFPYRIIYEQLKEEVA